MQAETRIGDWMHVNRAGQFWPLDPQPAEIHIEDIAGALARTCRFGGHLRDGVWHYSVAQHSVLVSRICDPVDALWGLLHDASEAYIGDIIRPLKRQDCFSAYMDVEQHLMRAICDRFGLPHEMPESVVIADEILLATEARDVKDADLETWTVKQAPLPEILSWWSADIAYGQFMSRFRVLTEKP